MGLFFRSIYLGWFLSLAYAVILYLSDRYKRESFTNVGIAFTAGVVATVFIGLLHNLFPFLQGLGFSGGFGVKVLTSFVRAAIPEELVKLAVFFATAWNFPREDFSEKYDAILYMGLIGAGFGAYEDFSYIFSHTFSLIGTENAEVGNAFQFITWQRAFPGHILINAVSGYFLGQAKFTEDPGRKWKFIGASLGVAILAHGMFNLAASGGGTGWLIIYVLALGRIFFYLRSELLQGSPYRLIEEYYRGDNLYSWEMMSKWKGGYSIETYTELYKRKESASMGYLPVFISIAVLYPVTISGVYYLNWLITKALSSIIH